MKKLQLCLLTIITLGMAAGSWAGPLGYSNLVVFGDSIVDTGNTQKLVLDATGGTIDPTPAALGYYEGRFTNGVNPADVVNQAIEGTNLTGSLFGGDNYSYGGARARTNTGEAIPIPDLTAQVDAYLADSGGVAEADALYLINVGGNDIRDILIDSLNPGDTIAAAAGTIATQVASLQSAGASEILFVGVGNVGGIPEIRPFGPEAMAAGRFLSESLNLAIQMVLAPLGVDFYDTIAFFDDVLPVLEGAGINTTEACLGSPDPDPAGAPTCNGYAFFDTVHPATQPLQLLGDDIVASLVPVPATSLLFVLGLFVIAIRRKQVA